MDDKTIKIWEFEYALEDIIIKILNLKLITIKTVIDRNDLELLDMLLKNIIKKSDIKKLKKFLKYAYKEKKKEVVKIFRKYDIKLSFFERIF